MMFLSDNGQDSLLNAIINSFDYPAGATDKDFMLVHYNKAFEEMLYELGKSVDDAKQSPLNKFFYPQLNPFNFKPLNFGDFLAGYIFSIPVISEIQAKAVIHDFNNIFTGLRNSVELLRKRLPDAESDSYLLKNIDTSVLKAAEVISQIMPGSSSVNDKQKRFSVNALLAETKDLAEASLKPDVVFVVKPLEQDVFIFGKTSQMIRVLLNLIINAQESFENEGNILLSAHPVFDNHDHFHKVLIKVTDNGCGIPDEHLGSIFDRKFSTKKKNYESGIGLNTVKSIISEHNGLIEVISKVGEGTTFSITLPVLQLERTTTEIKSILIAEDDEMVREILSELLESHGFLTASVQSGTAFLNYIKKTKSDLIIIDRKIPDIDGIECIRLLRESGNELIPVILASGSPSILEENLSGLKVNCVLQKPYDFDDLISIINSLI